MVRTSNGKGSALTETMGIGDTGKRKVTRTKGGIEGEENAITENERVGREGKNSEETGRK